MESQHQIFNRTELLVGSSAMEKIGNQHVIIFGVGGVGSWCAESLIRSGIHHLTIVDSDTVNITNVNRQLMATTKTIGQIKVEALKERLLDINPHAEITAIQNIYTEKTASTYALETFDYIIDAIDSLEHKAQLIRHACTMPGKFYSSMGAALKLDATKITTDEFWKVKGCPLARALRNKFKKSKQFPAKKFLCVYSDEIIPNQGFPHDDDGAPLEFHKVQINGTLAHTTAIFGFMLAGLVIQDILKK